MPCSTRHAILLLLSLACACMPTAAQQQVEDSLLRDAAGIVTNQTMTVAGHEFSDYFIAAWRDKQDSERYTLAIRERPSARSGSQVWIEFSHRRVYQLQLPAARAALKDRAQQAAEATYQAVMEADAQRLLVKDADLAGDEF